MHKHSLVGNISVKRGRYLESIPFDCFKTWSVVDLAIDTHASSLARSSQNSKPNHISIGDLPDSTTLTAWINEADFMVEVFGTGDSVAEIGEQLAWLGATLRSSPYEVGVAYSTPSLRILLKNAPRTVPGASLAPDILCIIDFTVQEVENHFEAPDGQCWHNMFRNPVVVKGYPIPRRTTLDTGLEIPLNIMAGLARTQRANTFNGTIFIKGFSTMLVPTNLSGDMLIWHLLYNKDGSRISYLDNTVAHVVDVSISYLENARHVVGWCSEVKNYAGMDMGK
jgi:hypothetical protein